MKLEKSCGAVIFREEKGERQYLLILNRKGIAAGHWGFPKGHVEGAETEHETATREIFEETGLGVEFIDGFRRISSYMPRPNVLKDVIYFLARATTDAVHLQEAEVSDYQWCNFEEACSRLTFDKKLLEEAHDFMNGAHDSV